MRTTTKKKKMKKNLHAKQKHTNGNSTHCGTQIPNKMRRRNEPNEYINNNSTKAKVKEDDGKKNTQQ